MTQQSHLHITVRARNTERRIYSKSNIHQGLIVKPDPTGFLTCCIVDFYSVIIIID